MSWEEYIPKDIQELYEVHDFKHASTILSNDFPTEFEEICNALRLFRFSIDVILASGGNESQLLPRLEAGRNGGCPVLVFGITTKLIAENE